MKILMLAVSTLVLSLYLSLPSHAADCAPATEIWTLEDLDKFRRTVSCVDGDVMIAPLVSEPIAIELPLLKSVSGALGFGGGILKELRLPNLESVGGELMISSASYPQVALTLVHMPKLSHVGGERIWLSFAPLTCENIVVPNTIWAKMDGFDDCENALRMQESCK